MAAFAPVHAPESIQQVAFQHLHHFAARILDNFITNQQNAEFCDEIGRASGHETLFGVIERSIQREYKPGLQKWWEMQEQEIRRRATSPDDVPALSAVLDLAPTSDVLIQRGLIGFHFLVRFGDSNKFIYFCPQGAKAEYAAPYSHQCVLDGLSLRPESPGASGWIKGLREIIVEGRPDKLGAQLAVSHGLCQYIPDLFSERIRPFVEYSEIDILSRNRSSLYLVLNESVTAIASQAKPIALIIIQSAIPNFLGEQGYIAFPTGPYTDSEDLGFQVAPEFFQSIFSLLYRHGAARQLSELASYGRLLSEVSRTASALAQDVKRDARSLIGHSQRKVWHYVRTHFNVLGREYKRLYAEEAETDRVRMAFILLDQLALSSDLGIDNIEPSELRGDQPTDIRDLSILLSLVKTVPSAGSWMRGISPHAESAFCSQCLAGSRSKIKLAESVLAAIWLDLAENAEKHGIPGDSELQAKLVWGCGHQLAHKESLHVVRTDTDAKEWRVDHCSAAELSSFRTQYGVFVGVTDFTPIPIGVNSIDKPGSSGLRLLLRLALSIQKLERRPVQIGYGPAPFDEPADGAKKIAFAVFPLELCD